MAVISEEMILEKIRIAHAAGVRECPFPPLSAAAVTWHDEVFRLNAQAALRGMAK